MGVYNNNQLQRYLGLNRPPVGFDAAADRNNQEIAQNFNSSQVDSGATAVNQNTEEKNKQEQEQVSASSGAKEAGGIVGDGVSAGDPIAGGAIKAGSLLVDGLMKAQAERQKMQLAQYQNQLSTISGGVQQYATGTQRINQDMIASMRGLS